MRILRNTTGKGRNKEKDKKVDHRHVCGVGFKRSPAKAILSYYDSMAHWNPGSTRPGSRVTLSW